MANFKDKTIIVTGAGYGIGKATALAFGREGADVVLAARSREKLEMLAEELRAMGTDPLVVPTDVASEIEVKQLFEETMSRYQKLDVLVNNAGITGPTKLAQEIKAEEWLETLNVNLTGAFYCAKHAIPIMVAQKRGSIVNISSVAGRIAYPLRTPYAASKWGMIGLSHSLAAELGGDGIRVNVVIPGPIEGERINKVIADRAEAEKRSFEEVRDAFVSPIPLKRIPTEEEVANAILYFAADTSAAITGQALNVDGGYHMH
ncbi:MAG: SDR family oxidoreductase [SAR324 cluster bacterium]|nr:SDR family oxidoreductase [SAR324 cluster bacterium]